MVREDTSVGQETAWEDGLRVSLGAEPLDVGAKGKVASMWLKT